MIKSRFNLGESLFEVVIALGVISLIIIGVVLLTSISVRNSTYARNNTQANRFAQELAEWLRTERDTRWNTFVTRASPGPGTTWCLNSLSWPASPGSCSATSFIAGSIFQREAVLISTVIIGGSSITDTVEAEVRVRWVDGQGTHTVRSSIQLTDWRVQ